MKDKRNIDPTEYHNDGFAPLHRACWGMEQRHTDTARVFVEHGKVPFNQKSKKGTTCKDITGNPATRKLMETYANNKKELWIVSVIFFNPERKQGGLYHTKREFLLILP